MPQQGGALEDKAPPATAEKYLNIIHFPVQKTG